jgi:plastocyanin
MRRTLTIAVVALALAGCGGAGEPVEPVDNSGDTGPTGSTGTTGGGGTGGGGGGGSTSNQITVVDNNFSPGTTTVTPGTTVTWTWAAGNYSDHNVTFETLNQSSPSQTTGMYQVTFSTAGNFAYRCTIHVGMNGNVVVQ